VLKLLKMAKGIRALLDTVMQALPQVGNLGLLFFLLFFIFAALGVELFGRLGQWPFNNITWNISTSFHTFSLFLLVNF
jgi:voltage-gated sodium channel